MMPSRFGRYLAAQSALECEALRAFAELVAELAARGAPPAVICAEHARSHAAKITHDALPEDARPTELAWEIHAWLVDTLTHEERAEVTSAILGLPDGEATRFMLAALARRITAT